MQVFIFQSEVDPDVVGFTPHAAGENLPDEHAPWIPLGGTAMQAGDSVAADQNGADAVLSGIDRDGFYLARSKTLAMRAIPEKVPSTGTQPKVKRKATTRRQR